MRYKVKIIRRGNGKNNESPYKLQTKNNSGILGNCEFIFDPFIKEYDWLVVIDDLPKFYKKKYEVLNCNRQNTLLITTEPSSISKYGKGYASQFKWLLTNQDEKNLPHNNAIRSQTGNIWFYGKSLDEILDNENFNKKKKISTVCSNKQQGHTIHKKRFEFTEKLQNSISELQRFGKGYNWIDIKADAIDNYEFHVAIENHYAKDVWTEKLADTFLGFAVPIYYGCPNVFEYFPEDSIILIDIFDEEKSIEKIKEIINTPGEYERRLPAIIEARRRVIEDYNILAMINKIVSENTVLSKSDILLKSRIYSKRKMRTKNYFDLLSFIGWKIKNFFLNFGANK